MPAQKPTYISNLVCAFKCNRALANTPVNKIKTPIIGNIEMECTLPKIKKNPTTLLIDITCKLVFMLKKNKRYTSTIAIVVP